MSDLTERRRAGGGGADGAHGQHEAGGRDEARRVERERRGKPARGDDEPPPRAGPSSRIATGRISWSSELAWASSVGAAGRRG